MNIYLIQSSGLNWGRGSAVVVAENEDLASRIVPPRAAGVWDSQNPAMVTYLGPLTGTRYAAGDVICTDNDC
jgi:hypothetical protein